MTMTISYITREQSRNLVIYSACITAISIAIAIAVPNPVTIVIAGYNIGVTLHNAVSHVRNFFRW